MNRPQVSIIVPNYNHSQFLSQRLESILNQTFQNFEVILLDDASTDDSMGFLKHYANHPKVSHFVVNKKNSGSPFRQWEKGLGLAKGEYVWIAESDDYCEPDFLETLISKIQKTTVLVYSASMNIDDKGKILTRNTNQDILDKERWYSDYSNTGKKEVKDYLRFTNTIPNASAVIFKRSLVREDYPFSEFQYSGDWHFWMDLLKRGSIEYSSKELNYFRTHAFTTRSPKGVSKDAEMFREFFRIIWSENTVISLLLNKDKFPWLRNALRIFEEMYGEGSIKTKLKFKDQKILMMWSRLEKLEYLLKRVQKKLLKIYNENTIS